MEIRKEDGICYERWRQPDQSHPGCWDRHQRQPRQMVSVEDSIQCYSQACVRAGGNVEQFLGRNTNNCVRVSTVWPDVCVKSNVISKWEELKCDESMSNLFTYVPSYLRSNLLISSQDFESFCMHPLTAILLIYLDSLIEQCLLLVV
jgi:hypothetical protein